jgi:hypothetical protein
MTHHHIKTATKYQDLSLYQFYVPAFKTARKQFSKNVDDPAVNKWKLRPLDIVIFFRWLPEIHFGITTRNS